MISWFKKVLSRVDPYAAHCYARIQSCAPLSLFYAFDGLTNGLLKRKLDEVGGGVLPATITFSYYLYSFFFKAKEIHDVHSNVVNLKLELVDTTQMILSNFHEHSTEAQSYLTSLKIDQSILEGDPGNHLNRYAELGEVYNRIYPHEPHTLSNLLNSLLHGVTHLNEYLLLRYFANTNLLEYKEEPDWGNLIGFSILVAAILSSCQSFAFHQQPYTPSPSELSKGIIQGFRFFRISKMDVENVTLLEEGRFDEFSLLAPQGVTKCYLSCDHRD